MAIQNNWAGRETQGFVNQAALVTAAPPRLSVTPEVSASPKAKQTFGDGTNDVQYLLFTLNAGDDVVAGSRLKNNYPDVFLANPGEHLTLESDVAITRLDVVAVGDDNDGTPAEGEQVDESADDEADYRTAMVTFDFDSTDDVRTLNLSCSERYSASTAGAPAATANLVDLIVRGGSHA